MRDKSKSKLSGFEEFDFLLKALPARAGNRVLQNATTAAARVGMKEIKKNAPVGDPSKKSSASKEYGPIKKNVRVMRLRRELKKGEKGTRISSGRSFWAMFYELGTRYQPARPFFAKAFEASSKAMLDKMKEIIGKGIEREAQKLKGKKS